jgi:phosphoserine phosphatase
MLRLRRRGALAVTPNLTAVATDTILVQISGHDRPGITAGLMDLLAAGDAELYDVEQVAVRGRLNLSLLVHVPDGSSAIKDLVFYGWERGLDVEFEVVEDQPASSSAGRMTVVTLMSTQISPGCFGAVARAIAEGGGNIERIVRLSRYPVVSYELAVSGGDLEVTRKALGEASTAHGLDIAVQSDGLHRRAKRLVFLDVDSTLIQDEVIDMLAEAAGATEPVRGITERAMAGELDFEDALRSRVALLEGLDASVLEDVAGRIRLTPGARTLLRTLKRLGMKVGVVSGGFTFFTDRLAAELGLDHAAANTLEIVDGRVTGRVIGPIVDRARKAEVLRSVAEAEGIPLAQTVAIGDGANDLDMLSTAGLGIAFNAKPVVQQAADTAVSVPYLDAILFVLGIRREDIEAADSDEGVEGLSVPVDGLPPV